VAIIGIVLLIGIVKKNGIMMVDFALEAERKHGKSATDAIYEACLLRFRPILMTTMAALLAGIPLALGDGLRLRAAPPAGHRHGGRAAREPGAHALHDPRHLHLLRQPGAALRAQVEQARPTGGGEAGGRPGSEHLGTLHSPAGGDDAAHRGRGDRRGDRVHGPARGTAPRGRLSDDLGVREPAGRQRRDHGVVRRHAAGAAARADRRRDGDDLGEHAREHVDHHSVRPRARHRRRGAGRGGGDQRGAHLSACQPAANPTYRKVNPADAPIIILGLTSDKYGPDKLYDEASTVVMQKLSQIQGVGQVIVGGGALPSVRVDAYPPSWPATGSRSPICSPYLSLQNSDLAKGQLTDGATTADILANDQISHADDYGPLVVGYHNGAAVRLSDVARSPTRCRTSASPAI
jgi:hypothetical protein